MRGNGELLATLSSRHLSNDPSGPYLVSLQSKKDLSAAVLNALQEKGPSGSPEPISPEAMKLIQEEWSQLRRVGILRFMKGVSLAKISAAQKLARFSSFAAPWESLNLIKNCFEDREVLARARTGVRACCAYVSRLCYV